MEKKSKNRGAGSIPDSSVGSPLEKLLLLTMIGKTFGPSARDCVRYALIHAPPADSPARPLPARWRWALAFWLTDETFAVVEHQLRHHNHGRDGAHYWLGSSLAMYGNWQLWTVVGVWVGQSVPGLATLGLDFAMVATFAAIVALQLRERPVLCAALAAGTVALLARDLSYKLGLMLATMTGVSTGWVAEALHNRGKASSKGQGSA